MRLRIKAILALLWSNASFLDFQNPCQYLQKRMAFYQTTLGIYNLGYSPILDGEIIIEIAKDKINLETPIKMEIVLKHDDEVFYFPTANIGLNGDYVEIYSLQNRHPNVGIYAKKVNRILYKVNENFTEQEAYLYYGINSLKDITPSFLVASNILLAYFKKMGYSQFRIISFLPTRWNAKEIMYSLVQKYRIENNYLEHDRIQENITNKFMRHFIRCASMYDNVHIKTLPYALDDALSLTIDSEFSLIDNNLFNEINGMINALDRKNGLL